MFFIENSVFEAYILLAKWSIPYSISLSNIFVDDIVNLYVMLLYARTVIYFWVAIFGSHGKSIKEQIVFHFVLRYERYTLCSVLDEDSL